MSDRRRQLGQHFTSRDRVREVLGALCFSALEALAPEALRARLAGVQIFDPACGDGAFLAGAWEWLQQLAEAAGVQVSPAQLHGIDIDPTALAAARERLGQEAHLVLGDALALDWAAVCAPGPDRYLAGNPPFVGKHLRTPTQRQAMERILPSGPLDYCAAWVHLAGRWCAGSESRVGLLLTSSVCQGEQVAPTWRPLLTDLGLRLDFARSPFVWSSDPDEAGVHCVIVGFGPERPGAAHLDGGPVPRLNAYLQPGPLVWVEGRSTPSAPVPTARYGSKPVDGGHLLLTEAERTRLLMEEPSAAAFVRPLVSAREWLRGEPRYCLWLPAELPAVGPRVQARIDAVAAFRRASRKRPTQRAAATPHRFAEVRQPDGAFVAIPLHTKDGRDWLPVGLFDAGSVVHNSMTCVPGGGLWELGLLSSAVHGVWLRTVGGRLTSGPRYSIRLVYNPFPWPTGPREPVEEAAAAVLAARQPGSLVDQYEPARMPKALRRAHEALDEAVDALFDARPDTRFARVLERFSDGPPARSSRRSGRSSAH